jgi:hypothetical protein
MKRKPLPVTPAAMTNLIAARELDRPDAVVDAVCDVFSDLIQQRLADEDLTKALTEVAGTIQSLANRLNNMNTAYRQLLIQVDNLRGEINRANSGAPQRPSIIS